MDAPTVALASTAVVSFATVVAALITTIGHIRATRDSDAKQHLRDHVTRLQEENQWLRKSLSYVLRQTAAYHVLEDIYIKQANPDASEAKTKNLKSPARKQVRAQCHVYPNMSASHCFNLAEKVESGQSFMAIIQPATSTESESTQ